MAAGVAARSQDSLDWIGNANDGEAAFAANCQRCHEMPDGIAMMAPGDTIAERQNWLWSFLAEHFAPEPPVRADIIAYLVTFLEGSAIAIPQGSAEAGEMAYASNCVECHVSGVRVRRAVPGADDASQARWLWSFLADHHAPNETRRADIIAYLATL